MDLAGAQLEIDSVDGVEAAVDLVAVDDLEQRRLVVLSCGYRKSSFLRAARRRQFDETVAALRHSQNATADRTHRRDAVDAAVDAAMQALDRFSLSN